MKFFLTILPFFLFAATPSFGQSSSCENPIFAFDFSGPGKNTSISCGKIFNTSIWVVVEESGQDTTVCWLWTDDIPLPQAQCSQPGNVTEVNIDIDQLGSPVPYVDFLRFIIQCDGVAMINDTINGGPFWPGQGSNVTTMTYTVPCGYPSVLKIYSQIRSTDPQNGFKVFSGGACGAQCYVPVLLPIKLSPLKGSLAGTQAHFDLDVYANGADPAEVILERSEDGYFFSEVATTSSNDGEKYHLVYMEPSNHYPYYRVKAIDNNGEISYSNVVYLFSRDLPGSIIVSPNPVHAGETISIRGPERIASAKLYNVQGGYAVDCTGNLQGISMSDHLLALPSSLAKGFYVLEVQSADNVLSRSSLVVQ